MTDSIVENIVSVRNAANSGGAPCGGNCLVNSNNDHIVNSLFGGNGSPCAAALCAAPPTVASNNDFGVGLIGTSSNNLVEQNSITGNVNCILIQAGASGNIIRQNIAAGNPPGLVSPPIRSDRVRYQGRSRQQRRPQHLREKLVHRLRGPGPSPCPSLPAVVPPSIFAVTATPNVLWPPNGKKVPVTIDVTLADDSDPGSYLRGSPP